MSHLLCVAPMMDVTDRHCRYLYRLLAPKSRLYSEMISENAILNGDRKRLLEFDEKENPLALQLGGSNPKKLAFASKIAVEMGYREINLNCGCPSKRVIDGSFGVSLMEFPDLVGECFNAIENASNTTVTVKHRLAINNNNNYEFTHKFVETLEKAGCKIFIVHARNAFIDGLSPKKNRSIPPIKMHFVTQLKKDFPKCQFIANGDLKSVEDCLSLLNSNKKNSNNIPLDGVMLGREVILNPWILVELSNALFSDNLHLPKKPNEILEELQSYFLYQINRGTSPCRITRQWLNLFKNYQGSKIWKLSLVQGLSPLEAYNRACIQKSTRI